uniref:Mediator of RNA polymerase II transcription subunit 4 n=1 Tax=Elaeophora elaphi TaxID=1147741 RepID=A0A0R3S6G3_9BILA
MAQKIVAFVLDRDRSCGSLTSLCESFRKKHAEIAKLIAEVPAYQQREREIRRLEAEVEARDKVLGDLQKQLMAAEKLITKMADKKVKEMRQSEANRVNSETVIRFANQISRTYAVAAPLGWQLGDTSRPYPTEAELRLSALAAPRVIVQAAPPALSLLRQPTASTSGMLRGSGRGASPMTSYSVAMQQQQRCNPDIPKFRDLTHYCVFEIFTFGQLRDLASFFPSLLEQDKIVKNLSTGSHVHMSDPERTVSTAAAPSSDSGSGACNVQTRPSAQELSSANAELRDFPDLTDFVNQRTEDDLNELFANRYTMANKLYAEVANGFPDPIIVCPWNKRPKRNFDY